MRISNIIDPVASVSQSAASSPGSDLDNVIAKLMSQNTDIHKLNSHHMYNAEKFGDNALTSADHQVVKPLLERYGYVERGGMMYRTPDTVYPPRAGAYLIKILRW